MCSTKRRGIFPQHLSQRTGREWEDAMRRIPMRTLLVCLSVVLCTAALVVFTQAVLAQNHDTARKADSDEQRIADLVLASRILVNEGVLDSFGHVTVRSASDPNVYFMPRAMPPGLVTAADIVKLNLDSAPLDPNAPRTNGERFIHGEIYKARPDVQAVVHSHVPSVIPFSITPSRPLRPVLHTAAFLPAQVPVFDPRTFAKDNPAARGKLQINNASLGAALAHTLGQGTVVLLRGHGDAVVGSSLQWAVYRAVYTDLNARVALAAAQLGPDTIYVDDDELKMHATEVFDVQRPWDNFVSRLPRP
jgi:ribulose-5-phosphate 4-epimerase/fuculose-1-phosphate aldolase